MAHIPSAVSREFVTGLKCVFRGKVRDTYELPVFSQLLLVVASNRVSIFDFVLNAEIPGKGEVLTAMNLFWRLHVFEREPCRSALSKEELASDLVAYGKAIDLYLPPALRGNQELYKRAVVVNRRAPLPIEAIARGYLTGSSLDAYRTRNRVFCGHRLPPGFHDGALLPQPIFTPSTKAPVGHDKPLDYRKVDKKFGPKPHRLTLLLYQHGHAYAKTRGIILADTKFEFGTDGAGQLSLIDEVLTPDSSRFWNEEEWKIAQRTRKSPRAWDKQFVREWGKTVGVNTKKPEKARDRAFVEAQRVPREVIQQTEEIYRSIFRFLTGMTLEAFQKKQLL